MCTNITCGCPAEATHLLTHTAKTYEEILASNVPASFVEHLGHILHDVGIFVELDLRDVLHSTVLPPLILFAVTSAAEKYI